MKPKKPMVLLVDDEERALKLYEALLAPQDVTTIRAKDGPEALKCFRRLKPDIIVLDVMMPEMDGFEVCRRIREMPEGGNVPVLMVSALGDRESRVKGLEIGASDFLDKPVDKAEFITRLNSLIKVKEYQDFLQDQSIMLERLVRERTAELFRTHEELKRSYHDILYRLAVVAEYRDGDTARHISRMGRYTKVIAEALGLPPKQTETLTLASPMHDIGKVGIPDNVLLKPGRLTAEEFEIVKTHTIIGARILGGSSSDIIRCAEEIALSHHERFEGDGYPRGLKGEEIPLSGRIVMLVDIYDALRSPRPYKPAFDRETTRRIMFEGDDRTNPRHFDPAVFNAFKKTEPVLHEIFESFRSKEPGELHEIFSYLPSYPYDAGKA
ncbi:MAG: HD domain-containing phosphohydrolase [Bacillota bacterium]